MVMLNHNINGVPSKDYAPWTNPDPNPIINSLFLGFIFISHTFAGDFHIYQFNALSLV